MVVPTHCGGFPTSSSQTRPNYQGFSNGPRKLILIPPMTFNVQSQPPPRYIELDKYEKRIRSDMGRNLGENNERMLKAITE